MQKIHYFDTGLASFNFMKNNIHDTGNQITEDWKNW